MVRELMSASPNWVASAACTLASHGPFILAQAAAWQDVMLIPFVFSASRSQHLHGSFPGSPFHLPAFLFLVSYSYLYYSIQFAISSFPIDPLVTLQVWTFPAIGPYTFPLSFTHYLISYIRNMYTWIVYQFLYTCDQSLKSSGLWTAGAMWVTATTLRRNFIA